MYTAESAYGITTAMPTAGPAAAPTAHFGTGDVSTGWRGLFDVNNPLIWLGGILAVAFGSIGVAGSVRLGRAKASGEIGKA